MIRDELQTALDEAIVSLQDEAVQTRDAADRLADDDQLAALLRANAEQYEHYAGELKPDLQSLDDLPREPEHESEILEGLVSRIQAALSGDPRASVLNERIAGIERVLTCMDAALSAQPPQPIADHLHATQRFLQNARQQLQSLHS